MGQKSDHEAVKSCDFAVLPNENRCACIFLRHAIVTLHQGGRWCPSPRVRTGVTIRASCLGVAFSCSPKHPQRHPIHPRIPKARVSIGSPAPLCLGLALIPPPMRLRVCEASAVQVALHHPSQQKQPNPPVERGEKGCK